MKKNSVTHGAFRKTSSKETKTNYPNKINRLLKTNITRRTLSATGKIRLVQNSPTACERRFFRIKKIMKKAVFSLLCAIFPLKTRRNKTQPVSAANKKKHFLSILPSLITAAITVWLFICRTEEKRLILNF